MIQKFNKEDLKYSDGYIWNGKDVVPVSPTVVKAFNKLEYALQMARQRKAYGKQEIANPFQFEFKSERENKIEIPVPETPVADKQLEESKKLMAEIDSLGAAARAADCLKTCPEAFLEFISETFFITNDTETSRFDLKTIGDPLKLNSDRLIKYLQEISQD